jgi:hypothetical protein
MFPGETFVHGAAQSDHYFIGLAGRAKAHADSFAQKQVARR